MRKVVILIATLVWCSPVIANDEFESVKQFAAWITYSYQNPEPDKLPKAIEFYVENAIEIGNGGNGVFGYIGGMVTKYPEAVSRWAVELNSKNPELLKLMILGIQLSALEQKALYLDEVFQLLPNMEESEKETIKNTELDLLKWPISRGAVLFDMCWGAFFASGDRRYIEVVIKGLTLLENKDDMAMSVAGRSASRSLSSNAFQHPLVYEILIDFEKQEVKNIALRNVIRRAEERIHTKH